jgi:hypothetical protein
MYFFNKLTFLILTVTVVSIPIRGFCLEGQSSSSPVLQILREGKATLSIDKKSILDEQGKIIASQIPSPVKKGSSSGSKTTPICNSVCAIIEKQCYADINGSVLCINVCKKEQFKCE